jgi:hypothetical protein
MSIGTQRNQVYTSCKLKVIALFYNQTLNLLTLLTANS